MKKHFPWFEVILVIVFLSAYVYAALSDAPNLPNRWFIRDDAYYYYKVAQNISEGHGSTFDGIHPTNGYHPLWLLICIPIFALARFDLILPMRVLMIMTGVIQISTALLLYRLVRSAISPPAGTLVGLYWAFNSYVLVLLYKTGVESSIALFFIALLLYLSYQFERKWRQENPALGQIAWLGIVAILATFGRLDLIFLAIIVGIWIVFRETPIRYLLPLDILSITASTLIAFVTRLGISAYNDAATSGLIMIAAGLLIKIPIFYFLGLYERPSNWKPLKMIWSILLSVGLSSFALSVLLLGGGLLHLLPPFSLVILAMDTGITFGFILLIRVLAHGFRLRTVSAQAVPPFEQLKLRWRDWLREGSVYYGIVGGALSAYMIWNKLAFGIFSPVSGEVKRWWGSFAVKVYGGSAKSLLSFFAVNPYSDFNAWQPFINTLTDWSNRILYKDTSRFGNPTWQTNFFVVLILVLFAMCLILFLKRRKSVRAIVQAGLIPLFVGSWIQIISYNATGYASSKEWYWLTEQILSIIMLALLIDIVFDLLLKRWVITRILMWGLIAWFGARTAFVYWRDTYLLMPYGQLPANTPYMDVVPFLEGLTKPGDIIGMSGGGNVGYFIHNRTIVNMDGLINSNEYFQALKGGTGSDYLYATGMRYVFANYDLLNALPYRGQYTNRLEPIIDWGGKDLMRFLPKPAP